MSKRYGRLTEGRLERLIGTDCLQSALAMSASLPNAHLPILGTPYFAHRGCVAPVISGGGFASLSDLISEATTGGKRQDVYFSKVGTTGVVGVTSSLWRVGNLPTAGTDTAAAAGGLVPDRTTVGAIGGWSNAAGGDTLHLTTAFAASSVVSNSLLLYDRVFQANQSLNATNTAWTGVPTRWVANSGEADSNFIGMEVSTLASATASNLTITYKDQDANTAEAAAATALRVSAAVNQSAWAAGAWMLPLNSPDTGVTAITNIQSSGANTGAANFFIGHPHAIIPCPVANQMNILDGINSAFNLAQIKDSACLALLECPKPATAATTYSGQLILVSG